MFANERQAAHFFIRSFYVCNLVDFLDGSKSLTYFNFDKKVEERLRFPV